MRLLAVAGCARTPLRPKYSGERKRVSDHVVVERRSEKRTQVADVRAAGFAEGEGETPEEPLEGDDGDGHHAEVDHRERVLPPEETRVEEADTGDHDPDEGGGREDPGDVAIVVDDGLFCAGVVELDIASFVEQK